MFKDDNLSSTTKIGGVIRPVPLRQAFRPWTHELPVTSRVPSLLPSGYTLHSPIYTTARMNFPQTNSHLYVNNKKPTENSLVKLRNFRPPWPILPLDSQQSHVPPLMPDLTISNKTETGGIFKLSPLPTRLRTSISTQLVNMVACSSQSKKETQLNDTGFRLTNLNISKGSGISISTKTTPDGSDSTFKPSTKSNLYQQPTPLQFSSTSPYQSQTELLQFKMPPTPDHLTDRLVIPEKRTVFKNSRDSKKERFKSNTPTTSLPAVTDEEETETKITANNETIIIREFKHGFKNN